MIKSFAVFLCLLVACAQASYVLDLTKDNFQQTLDENEFVLVEFFAPWCGHCKALAPEYEAAAQLLKDTPNVKLAKVDCTVEEDLAREHAIQGFPTVRLYRRGSTADPIEYNAAREANAIVAWLNKKAGPAATSLANEEEAQNFVTEKKTCVVGYFDNKDNEEYKRFLEVANSVDDFLFGEVVGVEGKKNGEVVLHREFDEPLTFTTAELAQQLPIHGYPYIVEVREGYQRHAERGAVIGLLVIDENVEGQVESTIQAFTPLAKSLADKVGLVYVPSRFHEQVRTAMGASDKVPTFVLNDINKNKNYPLPVEQEFTPAAVEEHITAALEGRLAPFFKSEPVPESNDGPVTVVVGLNFEEIVLDPSKDVLVEFYAPWCGHCKHLAPVWEELGEAFKDNDKVVIAKIDATANDNPVVQIEGFPTIFLFPATAEPNSHIKYQGGRSLEDFKAWLQENAFTLKGEQKEDQPAEHKDEL
ncbi:protein disulfide-isomerase precursor [Balamuthia mandrillaris]